MLSVFENRVLKSMFGLKRDEVPGECRKLQNGELHYLYYAPTIVRVIKSRRMGLVRHVVWMVEWREV
jgi:hypothetical protein